MADPNRQCWNRQFKILQDGWPPQDLKRKVERPRLEQLLRDGSVVRNAEGLLDYWGKKTCSGLLLMPATRHNLVHINESMRLL